jgi:hypothetical protein
VFETGAIREGIVPDSEKQFIFHEIVDIVNHVMPMGHVSGTQCYSGERSLSTIARLRAKGGLHYVKGMFHNYLALENTFKFDTRVKFEFLDNSQPKQKYSDFVLKLHGRSETNFVLNPFEMNALCSSVINVLDSEIDGSIIEKSNFYRLYSVFKACKGFKRSCFTKYKDLTFYGWVTLLYSRYNHLQEGGFNHLFDMITDQYNDLIFGIIIDYDEKVTQIGEIEHCTTHGFVFLWDFVGIIKDVMEFKPKIYKKAIIKGLAFTARGKAFREAMPAPSYKQDSVTCHYPHNALNYLIHNWWKSDDYSSWCEIKHYDPQEATLTTRTKTEMGQANYFFRLNWISDKLLFGLAFGSMTLRHTSYDARRRHHYVSLDSNSFNEARQFVCLNYVCSTKLALSVLNKDHLPIVKRRKFGSARWTVDAKVIKIAPPESKADRIYFLEMHPERVDYMYRNFESDLDGSRNWDINNSFPV